MLDTNRAVHSQNMATFGFRKKRDSIIDVAKTKMLISCTVCFRILCKKQVFSAHFMSVAFFCP